MVMLIFSMNYILGRDGKNGTGFRFNIYLTVFLEAIDKTFIQSMNTNKMEAKQKKQYNGYSPQAFLICGLYLLHLKIFYKLGNKIRICRE